MKYDGESYNKVCIAFHVECLGSLNVWKIFNQNMKSNAGVCVFFVVVHATEIGTTESTNFQLSFRKSL